MNNYIINKMISMKKYLLFIATAICLIACSDSKEEKAEKLVKKALNSVIVNIETYEPIETTVDSAFAPLESPEVFNFYAQMPVQMRLYVSSQEKAEDAKRTMSIYSNPYSSYDIERYNSAKEEYEMYSRRAAEFEEKMHAFSQKMERLSKEEPVFCGYKVRHKFRFVSKEGDKTIGEYSFLMNKDLTEIESMIDLDDEVIKALVQISEMKDFAK